MAKKIPGTSGKKMPRHGGTRIPGSGRMNGGMMTRFEPQDTSGEYAQLHRQQVRDIKGSFAGGTGFAWQGLANINANLLQWSAKTEQDIREAAYRLAQDMEEWAMANHPWENRTSHAEYSLQSEVIWEKNGNFSIWLGHGDDVEYGVWLEVRWGGRFAIILPTIYYFAPQLGDYVRAAG